MATIAPAASRQPTPRPDLPLWGRLLLWTVRLVLVFLIIKVVKNPWPLLRSRVFPSLVLWIVFSVYWAIAGRNSAPTKSSESKASTWFHQIVLVLALLLLFIPVVV